MKKLSQFLILSTVLSVICATCSVYAAGIPVQSNDHFTMYVASFIEKMEKIKTYIDEIKETTKTIDSLGDVGKSAVANALKSDMDDFLKFTESFDFEDIDKQLKISDGVADALSDVNDAIASSETVKSLKAEVNNNQAISMTASLLEKYGYIPSEATKESKSSQVIENRENKTAKGGS